ncbi:MAG: phosphoglycolate phosphatase [Zetaproteobacteria bacterium CG06_land_8_20_14_3_00_59_53]|nr:MAG: phosphoglycolate phosphatase [Zetaproteobacteria bacterium CG2_30_59_37]PIO90451.1 MAG: phosphoglycolate phosphatase [Zetaproteobacteria bacterium CG23_combo_of_CG06-09_8_20_14_all_59_86]PIQ65922.1 MAG: phosphoglycolate phosphatase [Zetaproteobacteria bacterium CG11_big_fil_rev_8_21_14_0_20_59_439]PIU71402.1 MAG: phosphoglycolate phosphatase [Zetaproteobacteria bacterium CG06_land_8_20_14_3_00_59_53]PIU97658.1 MAG: phosphoglycolate phosphatase [Zetaproteobacteria bacterium CG03_land_8_2
MNQPKAFIFDLDGTLVDALPDIRANANRALNSLGYDFELSLDETRPHVGGGAQKLASNVLGKPMDDPETMALYHAFADIYEKHPADFSVPFPGVMHVLDVLRDKGIPMCCVTAKPAKARIKVLDALGLTSYLTLALSPEDGFAKKPAPDMLVECCRVMGVSPADTVMVGDTRFDIEAGFNAECLKVCYCEHGYQDLPEEFEGRVMRLKNFTDLLNLLHD